MDDVFIKRWNDRYGEPEYAYGVEPNNYLRSQLDKLDPGKILFAAEGEGRNAVYAAKNGWNVSAFDMSNEGKKKAKKLAESNDVSIEYQVGKLPELNYKYEEFDALALIYSHFSAEEKFYYYQELQNYLRPGGIVILEVFSKQHLSYRARNPKVGGPLDIDILSTIEEIKSNFAAFNILEATETEVELKEGLYHNGIGHVVRFVGAKK